MKFGCPGRLSSTSEEPGDGYRLAAEEDGVPFEATTAHHIDISVAADQQGQVGAPDSEWKEIGNRNWEPGVERVAAAPPRTFRMRAAPPALLAIPPQIPDS